MRRILFIVFVLAVAASCGGDDDSPESSSSIRVGGYEPVAIDPAMVVDTDGTAVAQLLCEGLTVIDANGAVEPAAASEWSVSEDGTTYTFDLRDDLTFSDGTPVDASSFAFAWNRLADPDLASENAGLGGDIEGWFDVLDGEASGAVGDVEVSGIRPIDATTLEVVLVEPNRYFPLLVAKVPFCPADPARLSEPDAQAEAAEEPVGNGPYRLAGPWERGRRIVMDLNENYRADAAGPEEYEFVFFDDPATAYREFVAGNLEVALLPAAERGDAEGSDAVVIEAEGVAISVLALPDVAPFDDPTVRAAMRSSLDMEAIAERVLEGTAAPAGSFILPAAPEYVGATCDACEFEGPAEGIELGPVELTFPADSGLDELAEAIAADWRTNLAAEVTLQPLEFSAFLDLLGEGSIEGPYLPPSWSLEIPTAYDVLGPFFAQGSPTAIGVGGDEFDELLATGRVAESEEEAADALRQADEIVSDELAALPLTFDNVIYVARSDLAGLSTDYQGRLQLERLRLS